MSAQTIMEKVREAGGDLTLNGDKIHVSAPSPLPDNVLSELRSHKSEVIALLSEAGNHATTTAPPPDSIRERFQEAVALAESEGGLSRIDAELSAYDQVKTCVQCGRETLGEENAVRVAGGGWLHTSAECYNQYFNFQVRV